MLTEARKARIGSRMPRPPFLMDACALSQASGETGTLQDTDLALDEGGLHSVRSEVKA